MTTSTTSRFPENIIVNANDNQSLFRRIAQSATYKQSQIDRLKEEIEAVRHADIDLLDGSEFTTDVENGLKALTGRKAGDWFPNLKSISWGPSAYTLHQYAPDPFKTLWSDPSKVIRCIVLPNTHTEDEQRTRESVYLQNILQGYIGDRREFNLNLHVDARHVHNYAGMFGYKSMGNTTYRLHAVTHRSAKWGHLLNISEAAEQINRYGGKTRWHITNPHLIFRHEGERADKQLYDDWDNDRQRLSAHRKDDWMRLAAECEKYALSPDDSYSRKKSLLQRLTNMTFSFTGDLEAACKGCGTFTGSFAGDEEAAAFLREPQLSDADVESSAYDSDGADTLTGPDDLAERQREISVEEALPTGDIRRMQGDHDEVPVWMEATNVVEAESMDESQAEFTPSETSDSDENVAELTPGETTDEEHGVHTPTHSD